MEIDLVEVKLYLNAKRANALAELCNRAGSGAINFSLISNPVALVESFIEIMEALTKPEPEESESDFKLSS